MNKHNLEKLKDMTSLELQDYIQNTSCNECVNIIIDLLSELTVSEDYLSKQAELAVARAYQESKESAKAYKKYAMDLNVSLTYPTYQEVAQNIALLKHLESQIANINRRNLFIDNKYNYITIFKDRLELALKDFKTNVRDSKSKKTKLLKSKLDNKIIIRVSV